MIRPSLFLVAPFLVALALASGASAQNAGSRSPESRYQITQQGDIVFVSNSIYTCAPVGPGVTETQHTNCTTALGETGGNGQNDSYRMTPVDVDGDPSTHNSSTADLSLPAA